MKRVLAGGAVAVSVAVVGVLALTGGDSGVGVSVSPGDSWQAAYAAASPGDVVTLKAGAHSFQVLTGGKDGLPVRFEAEQGAFVSGMKLLGVKNLTLDGINDTGLFTARTFPERGTVDAAAVLTENVTITNADLRTFLFRNVKNVTLADSRVGGQNVSTSGLGVPKVGGYPSSPYRPSTGVRLERVFFRDIIRTVVGSTHVECLFIDGGTDGVVIVDSEFTNCGVFDLFFGPSSSGPIANVTVQDSLLDVPRDTVGNAAPSAINAKGGGTNYRFVGNSILGAIRLDDAAYPGLSAERNAFSNFVRASTAPCDLNDCYRNDLHVLSGADGVPVGGSPRSPTTTPPAATEVPTTTPGPPTEPHAATTEQTPERFSLRVLDKTGTTVAIGSTPPAEAANGRFSKEC